MRRLVSQNSSVEEIQAIGDGLAQDFKAHQEDLARLLVAKCVIVYGRFDIKLLKCRLVSEVQGVVEEAGGNLKHLSAMEEVV